MRCIICNAKVHPSVDICEACQGVVKDVYVPTLEVALSVIPYTENGGRVEPKHGQD